MSDAIVQFFDQPFSRVMRSIPRLARLGMGYALISPPQKSHSSRSWWGRYQPVDFRSIEGPLGDRAEFAALCRKAREHGVTVLVDAVLHHLSNEGRYLSTRGGQIVRADYPCFSIFDLRPGGGQFGRGRPLPELRHETAWVRQQLRDYLRMLVELGAGGFRFDAAKHLPAELFSALLSDLPPLLCVGEMVYAEVQDYPESHLRWMKAYDFPLARSFKQALAPGGDARLLLSPSLWGPRAVTFVNHHDLVKRPRDFGYFRISDRRDRQLAYAYLLAREHGQPLVYGGDVRLPEVRHGLAFHRDALGSAEHIVEADRHSLVLARGQKLMFTLNKSGRTVAIQGAPCPLHPGRYLDDLNKSESWVDQRGLLYTRLAPRSAGLFRLQLR